MLVNIYSDRSTQSGISLIELLIGLSILAGLLAIAAPFAGQMVGNAKIRTAAESILSGLQLARASAVNNNAQVQFVLDTGVDASWTVSCVNPSPVDPTTGVSPCPAVIQSHPAAEGTSKIVVAADITTVVFNGFGSLSAATIANISPATLANFCIGKAGVTPVIAACAPSTTGLSYTERRLKVTVLNGGAIRMCDPSLPSGTNLQAC